MLYILFFILATAYNWRKFHQERSALLSSLIEAKTFSHREMILSHHFYVYIFEGFLAIIVAHFISEKSFSLGILSLGFIYIVLLFLGYFLYQSLVRYIERQTKLVLLSSFRQHLTKELRVSFALIMLPILLYSVINLAFQGEVQNDWGNFWFLGLLFNIISVSVLTIICSVIIMLRLIPNREVTEPEYVRIISKRLEQIHMPNMRVRWIETDIKNAFVVGLKILKFSNQTMFIGKNLRTMLTLEEFDAVIAHELSHVANRHIHKRVIDLLRNLISILLGSSFLMFLIFGLAFIYWGEDTTLHSKAMAVVTVICCMIWFILNYALLFDTIRSHEFEADAYAVIELGVDLNVFKSALEKLTKPEELPEYLKLKKTHHHKQGVINSWIKKVFSTHPDLSVRFSSLQEKVDAHLPFNFYISPVQKVRKYLSSFLNWKVSLPLSAMFAVCIGIMVAHYWEGHKYVRLIQQSTAEEIIENKELPNKINSRPSLLGRTLMFNIVQKRDAHLIDHFLVHGADKGKTLVYISQLKDFRLFRKYYSLYEGSLSEDEYFLVLRKTAEVNFTEGYRYLVNAERFEELNPEYKQDISRLHKLTEGDRLPASVKPVTK